jgi:hypothetical protein
VIDRDASDMIKPQIPEVGFLMHPDARVVPQDRGQLITANVHSDHLLAAAVEQDLGEPTGRSSRIEGSSGDAELEVVERTDELARTSRDEWIDGSTNVRGRRHSVARPLYHSTVHHDFARVDHRLSLITRSRQPAPDHLQIKALGHRSSRLNVVRLILVRSIQGLVQ